jgi:putative transposase
LWEGRCKACPVDRESYLLHCYRYIELNPVRARMVGDPGDYRWSSYSANANGRPDLLVTPHPSFLALDADPLSRQAAYRELVRQAVSDEELTAIRRHLQRQHALGTERFRAAMEAQLARISGRAKIVRPRKAAESAL